ncbi:MAG: hypothetical protein HZC54_03835 [Verrucomicrobia bacterium]|nr:hypothetical protein [Verrucomicrobiota bacterium]
MADYIPGSDDRLSYWLDRYLAGATENATVLELGPADLTALGARITDFKARLATCGTTEAAARAATAEKKNSRRLVEQMVRTLSKRFTTLPGFTQALAELLGIVAPAAGGGGESGPPPDAKPELKGAPLLDGAAEIKFTKGDSDGVNLYSQLEGETDFSFLARDTHSPYVDNRPLRVAGKPERRKYMARYLKNDQEYGTDSDIITVTCSP